MSIGAKAAGVVVAFAVAVPLAATAQYTGVSHPDDTPITNSPEPARTLNPPAAAQSQLKPSPYIVAQPYVAPDPAPRPYAAAAPSQPSAIAASTPNDVDAGIVTEAIGPPNQLPVGTMLRVRLAQDLSTLSTASGTLFTALLAEPVKRNGRVLLPAGSTISGLVTDIHGGKRISGAASIHLRTTSITLPDGTRYQLRAQVVDTGINKQVKVDREGTILRRDHAGKTAATLGLTTGAAAVTGAVIAGPPGALVGAGVGAGIGTAVWLKQDRQMDIPAEAKITFWLTQPLTVGGE